MIKSEKLLNNYIRPYIYSLVEVCADKSDSLVHTWELGIEKNWKAPSHYTEDLFAYAYIYLTGFYDRHSREVVGKEDIKKEFEQFFYLFEIALKEFDFFEDEILFLLEEATLKVAKELKIIEFHVRCKKLMKNRGYEEPKESKKELKKSISKKYEPVEEIITERVEEDKTKALTSKEIRKLTERWVSETSKITPPLAKPPPKEPPTTPPIRKPPKKPKIKKITPKIFKRLAILLFLIAIVIYAAFTNTTEEIVEERPAIKTVYYNETVSDKISFKEYLENIYQVDGNKVELKASLKRFVRGSEKAGVYVESITDDYNNTIELIDMNYKFKELFPKKGTTKEVYKIKGTFKRRYKTLLLDPRDIQISKRDPAGIVTKEKTVEYNKKIVRNVTKAKSPMIRAFVFNLLGKEVRCEDNTLLDQCSSNKPYLCSYNGLIRKPTKCGCPKGERIYKKECIKKVECSDGTLSPECSKNKPKQCVNGKLVDNADLCGCPDDYKKIGKRCEKIKRCSDGTIYGECSKKKPYFCSAGKLVRDSDLCGCDWGYKPWKGDCIDSNKAEALEASEYVNEIRKDYGRNELQWSDDLYELAMYRCKDMYNRKYFDHVTPDGKCVKDFKSDYGLGGYTIAENAGAVMYGYYGDEIDYASYADPKSQVDSWMGSRGHRYNLLYPSHKLGVVACYKGACVFLGANTDTYGLGAGPCTTGDEGHAFWDGIGKQPGEI